VITLTEGWHLFMRAGSAGRQSLALFLGADDAVSPLRGYAESNCEKKEVKKQN
jgi:hypothetical protein